MLAWAPRPGGLGLPCHGPGISIINLQNLQIANSQPTFYGDASFASFKSLQDKDPVCPDNLQ